MSALKSGIMTKGRDESRYRQEATASRTGSSPPRVRDGKRVEYTAPSPQPHTTLIIDIGPAHFSAEGEQWWIDECMKMWLEAWTRLMNPIPKMVDGDLYGGI